MQNALAAHHLPAQRSRHRCCPDERSNALMGAKQCQKSSQGMLCCCLQSPHLLMGAEQLCQSPNKDSHQARHFFASRP